MALQHIDFVFHVYMGNDDEQLQLTAIMNNSFRTRTKKEYHWYVIKMLSLSIVIFI